MCNIEVSDRTLASVLILDRKLEEYPEPYRSQQDITLSVSFKTYLEFIDKFLDVANFLATNTLTLKDKLQEEDFEFLLKAFYRDMACAVVKELWFSPKDGEFTHMHHYVEDSPVFDSSFVGAYTSTFKESMRKAKNELLSIAEGAGYIFPKYKLANNLPMWEYATLLYAMSSSSNEFAVGCRKWSMKGGV